MKLERSLHVSVLGAGLLLSGIGLLRDPAQGTNPPPPTQQQPLPAMQLPPVATADSNGTMIAVTGMDITGSSILYLVDTERRQIAVYQATGGGASTASIRLVGARNIDLDLRLDGYNDKSEFSYKELEQRFIAQGFKDEDL
jgi:hypothetical protein